MFFGEITILEGLIGKEIVKKLDKQNIIIDASHLSDGGIDDVLSIIDSPIRTYKAIYKNANSHRDKKTNKISYNYEFR